MGYGGYNNGGGGWGGGHGQRQQGGGGYRGPSGQRPNYVGNRGGGQQRGNPDGPATPNQRAFLERNGQNPNVSFRQASQMIDRIKGNNGGGYGGRRPNANQYGNRQSQQNYGNGGYGNGGYGGGGGNQCTAKQAAVLQKYGYDPNVSFDEATATIDELAANGWQRPDGGGQEQGGYDDGYQGDGGGYQDNGGYDDGANYGGGGYGNDEIPF